MALLLAHIKPATFICFILSNCLLDLPVKLEINLIGWVFDLERDKFVEVVEFINVFVYVDELFVDVVDFEGKGMLHCLL